MKKLIRTASLLLLAALVLQTGYSVYAAVNNSTEKREDNIENASAASTAPEIRTEVKEVLSTTYPDQSEQAIQTYVQFLSTFHVHESIQQKLDLWIVEGQNLADIMIAYTYLYHQFGQIDDLMPMLSSREQGAAWTEIFRTYRESHPAFVPRSFEPGFLSEVLANPELIPDDLMLADVVSTASGIAVEDVLQSRLDQASWQEITAEAGILFSADVLPQVSIPTEELHSFISTEGLTEDQVVDAFVFANKLDVPVEVIIEQVSDGATEEAIFAAALEQTYLME